MSTIVETYQALVWKELKEKLEPKGWNFEDATTYLSETDLVNSQFIPDLINRGLLIRYSNGFRTAHTDLLYRLTKIRYFRNRDPIPLERDFSVIEEQVPDFGAYRLIDILKLSNVPETDALLIEKGVKTGDVNFKGLSTYQAKYLESILKGTASYFSVVAPTASGKSLIFFIPTLVSALQRLREGKSGVASIIMYPRKALASDQIQRFLRTIDFLNQQIDNRLTIAIDDSDTLKMERKLRERESIEFRGLTCPRSNGYGEKFCGRKLLLYNNGAIKCEAGHSFDYIVGRRRDIVERKPMILVTNIWRAYYMMLKRDEVDLLQNLDFLVMDESHVYTGYRGGHIALVLQLLRYLSSLNREGHLTKFIFSSATISNPTQFISSLAGISEEELFYQDYMRLTPSTGKRRLLVYVYLLPSPRESAETLAEAIIEAVNLWCHKYGFKAIAFTDSVSTVTTFLSYFHDTILSSRREAREIIDHIFDNDVLLNNSDDDFSWYTLTPPIFTEKDLLKKFLLEDFKKSIDIHYGSLDQTERSDHETKLKQGLTRLMIATSTLEVGINLSDIAAIIQYKLPITPESFSQRVGRGGRDETCYRISMGILVLPPSPIGTLYMYNRGLREKLEKVEALPPLRIGKRSENLVSMHALTMLLLMRNLEHKDTFLRIHSISEAITACRELRADIQRVLEFNKNIGLIDEQLLRKSLQDLEKALEFSEESEAQQIDFEGAYQILERAWSCCFDAWMSAKEIIEQWPIELGPPHPLLKDLKKSLGHLKDNLKQLKESLSDAIVRKDLSNIQIEEGIFQLPDPNDVSDQLSIEWLGGIKARDYPKYKPREVFSNKINKLTENLRYLKEDYLPRTISILQTLQKIKNQPSNIRAAMNSFLRKRIQEEIRAEQERSLSGIAIFKLMEILMSGRRIFSPLLDQPVPKLMVEEQYV
jgi:hypothetical protein